MQENNFEDRMRQKMTDLKLDPSATLWPKVAVKIQKKDKDRRLSWLFFLSALLIGGAGFYFWNESTTNPAKTFANSQQAIQNNSANGIDNKVSEKNSTIGSTTNASETIANSDVQSNKKNNNVTNNTTSRVKNNDGVQSSGQSNEEHLKQATTKTMAIKYTSAAKTKMRIGNVAAADADANDVVGEDVDGSDLFKIIYRPELVDAEKNPVGTNRIPSFKSDKTTASNSTIDTRSTNKNKDKKSTSSKWQFGLGVSAGNSSMSNGLLGNSEKAYDAAAPNSSTGGGPGQIDTIFQSVPLKSNIGFKIGVIATKKISSKISLVSGLNYIFYSTKFVAENSGSNGISYNAFIRIIGTKYTNQYHFIELPVSLQWRLTKNDALPVYLETGVSVSQLVSSTALQFSTYEGYYKDNSLLNKTQTSLSLKLLVSLGKNWLVGPAASYHLSPVAGTDLYQNKHYSYIGIHLQRNILNR